VKEDLLERGRIRRPLRHILVQWVAMKSKIIPPIMNSFFVDIETSGESGCL